MMDVGGIPCRLQELAGSDPERLKAAYEALSEQSVYLRFMRAKQGAAELLAIQRQKLNFFSGNHGGHLSLRQLRPAIQRKILLAR